jgi:hypothetical protein
MPGRMSLIHAVARRILVCRIAAGSGYSRPGKDQRRAAAWRDRSQRSRRHFGTYHLSMIGSLALVLAHAVEALRQRPASSLRRAYQPLSYRSR